MEFGQPSAGDAADLPISGGPMNRFCILSSAILLTGVSQAGAGQHYVATDLGELSGSPETYQVRPRGINNFGQVVGYAEALHGGSLTHPFLWTPQVPHGSVGAMTDLNLLPDPLWQWGGATGINDSGQVVGYSGTPNSNQAFVWTPSTPNGSTGAIMGLPNPPGDFTRGRAAGGINASGQVVGVSIPPSGDIPSAGQTAFVWKPTLPNGDSGTLTDIVDTASASGSGFTMSGINSAGQFVSNCNSGPSLWTESGGGVYSQTILSDFHEVTAINNQGQVLGTVRVAGPHDVAAIWTPTTPNATTGSTQLLPVNTSNAFAKGMNSNDQVVGIYPDPITNQEAAFVYDPALGTTDLNTALVNSITGWTLVSADGINDSGQIIATGAEYILLPRGNELREVDHTFLLTPTAVPEPLNAVFGLLIAPCIRRRRRIEKCAQPICGALS